MRALVVVLAFVAVAGCKRAPQEPKCERQAGEFAGVRVVGSFSTDLGCVWQAYVLDGQRHTLVDAAPLLAREGWATADSDARATLARRYVESVMLDQVAQTAPPGLEARFTPPSAQTSPDGSIAVSAWQTLPGDFQGGRRYARREVRLGADGNVKSARFIETTRVR